MPNLPLRSFGATGLNITPLCIGCAPLGDMPETFTYTVGEERALATIRAVFQSPINFIDTAYSYGDGESERRIGLVLKELGGVPPGYVVASKADRNLQTGDFSGDQMRRSVERSLRLLGLDSIEMLYLHDPEHTTFEAVMAKDGVLEALQRCKDEGLIGHLGVAGGPADLMIRYVETGAFEGLITHNRYTLLNRSADRLLTIAHERGLGVANAAPYGSGMLAKGPGAYPRYAYQAASDTIVERAHEMERICGEYGVRLAAAALHFSMRDPRVHTTIVGISKPERIADTLELAGEAIPEELWTRLDAVGWDTADPEAERWS
jgi:D-threo-aldose 1-dehydrogenase